MRKRSLGPLILGTVCLALVAFAFYSRKPLCIDSKLVERIDRVGANGTASMYRCGLYRKVDYNPKLVQDAENLKPRLQKIETFLSLIGMPNERLNLTIIEGKEDIFRLQGRQVFFSESILRQPLAIEKAVLKAWYRERISQSMFDLRFVEESVTDLMLYAATGKIIEEETTEKWPQALMVTGEYCTSPWRALEDIASCQNKVGSREINIESLRGLAVQSLASAYVKLEPQEQFQFLMQLNKRIGELQYVPKQEKASTNSEQETIADAAQFLNEWRELVVRVFPAPTRAKMTLYMQQELFARGFADSFLSSYFDWVFQLREQDKKLFQELLKKSADPRAPSIAVQVGDWVWMLPNKKPVPAKAFESLRAYRGVVIGCGKPDQKALESWAKRVQHLTAVDDCGPEIEVKSAALFHGDLPAFALSNPKIRFMQVHLPSFELSLKRGENPLAVGRLRYHEKANVYESMLPVAPITWYRP